jgi:hypothetical protein
LVKEAQNIFFPKIEARHFGQEKANRRAFVDFMRQGDRRPVKPI